MGCVYKRGTIWWIKYFRNGRQQFESSGSDKETEARRLMKLREGDIARGLPVTPRIGRMRFEEALEDFLNDQRANNRRRVDKLEARIEKHLVPFFRGRRMANLTTADVRAYVAVRKTDTVLVRKARRDTPEVRSLVKNGTINRELTALKRMFALAVQGGKLLHRPHIELLQENNVRQGFFERHEHDAVVRRLSDALAPIVTFAYVTGWRITSEVLPLQWRHVDLVAREVRLDPGTTKNKEGRVFPLTVELARLLEQQDEIRKALAKKGTICPFVFHRNGKRIVTFAKAFKAACRAAGCPGRIQHDLRRSAVRNMVRAGIPEAVAMKLTGHKTRSVFEQYNIVNDADLRGAAAKLSDHSLESHQTATGRG